MDILGKLQFYLAAFNNDDGYLNRFAKEFAALKSEIEGRHVALVGNARSLSEKSYGEQINKHDIVIRINKAPMTSSVSHGTKTDWLALATSLTQSSYKNLDAANLIWMSHKRKRLKSWMSEENFYLFPMDMYKEAKSILGAQPSTGFMLLFWLSKTSFASLNLYGFDFFKSLSLSGSRTESQVPHDFKSEMDYFNDLTSKHVNISINN